MSKDEAVNIKAIRSDRKVRRALAFQSHLLFFNIYFPHYVLYPTADFQKEMFALTERDDHSLVVVVAFRGSAKSTIFALSQVLWSIIGRPQKKFVLIVSQTQTQARQHLLNIKRELEDNELLKKDLGPFVEDADEWGASALSLKNFGAKIMAVSTEQSIRGLRSNERRPDLIVADDVEDLNSVRTKEGRKKTFDWFTGEVIPCGDQDTKITVIGNLLHEDSLLMRLKESIQNGSREGVYKEYPLIDDNDHCLWSQKYPTAKALEMARKMVGSDAAWYREYLLKIISDQGRVIHPDWIHYYDKLPGAHFNLPHRYTAMSADLAISQKESADYTAIVMGKVFGYGEEQLIYILPNPINRRLTYPQTLQLIKNIYHSVSENDFPLIFIEDVGYQKALVQELVESGYLAEGFKVQSQDKRSRLALTSALIQSGRILFPRHGCEELLDQILNFHTTKHDDLADAFSILILQAIFANRPKPRVM